ncbi:MAG: adenosylmethionine decarboxylase [Akkermansiaceae bacterium]
MSELPSPPSHPTHLPHGVHYLLECSGIDVSILKDKLLLETLLHKAATDAGATIVETTLHEFNPHGLSGVIVIAESHIAIHTWPEHQYAAIDVFTCGDNVIAEKIYHNLVLHLQPEKHTCQIIKREPPK